MIVAGTSPLLYIDHGSDEPGMTLQYRDVKNGYAVWRDYHVDDETNILLGEVRDDLAGGVMLADAYLAGDTP